MNEGGINYHGILSFDAKQRHFSLFKKGKDESIIG